MGVGTISGCAGAIGEGKRAGQAQLELDHGGSGMGEGWLKPFPQFRLSRRV